MIPTQKDTTFIRLYPFLKLTHIMVFIEIETSSTHIDTKCTGTIIKTPYNQIISRIRTKRI